MGAAMSTGDPAPDGLAHKLFKLQDLRRHGWLTADEVDWAVKHLLREFSTPDPPPLSTGANGAIVATASPADATASASSVVPDSCGRSPLGDPSDCGLHGSGTTVPLNGAAKSRRPSLHDYGAKGKPYPKPYPVGQKDTGATRV